MARQYIQRLEEEGICCLSNFIPNAYCGSEFIEQVTTTLDGFGLETETRVSRTRKGKERKMKQRKNVQKIRYAFNKASKRSQKYKDYFDPGQETESRLLGLDDLVSRPWTSPFVTLLNPEQRSFRAPTTTLAAALEGSSYPGGGIPETYEETIEATLERAHGTSLKRASAGPEDHDVDRALKKVKISVAVGIDLAE
jgi:meiosis-specific protein